MVTPSQVLSYNFCPRSHELNYDLKIPSAPHLEGISIHNKCEEAQRFRGPPDVQEPYKSNYIKTVRKLKIGKSAQVELTLKGSVEKVPLSGRIDLVDLSRGIVLDWKTGKGTKGYEVQGWIYHQLVEENYGFCPECWFSYLQLGIIKKMSLEDLAEGEKAFWKFINRKDNRKPRRFNPDNGQCRACGYRFVCEMDDKSLSLLRR